MKIDPKKLAMVLKRVQMARAMSAPQGGAPMAPAAPMAQPPMPPRMMPR